MMDVDQLIDALLEREGGYVNNPADKGGPTSFGITEAVARSQGYAGPMQSLPREEAAEIYTRLYWLRPRFDEVAKRSDAVAAELFDTGVNMGPAVAVTFLQRALTALNRNGRDYPDLVPDGRIGPTTLTAFDSFLKVRGRQAARLCFCARSKHCRASATSASPSCVRQTRPSSTAGWRTALAIPDSRARVATANFANFQMRKTMSPLPSPTSFAEGQRLIYGWLAAAAGIFCGTCSVLMVCLLMWGNWSRGQEHTIVVIFGGTLAGYIIGMMSVTIGLLVGGPVGRFKGSASPDGVSLEADGDQK